MNSGTKKNFQELSKNLDDVNDSINSLGKTSVTCIKSLGETVSLGLRKYEKALTLATEMLEALYKLDFDTGNKFKEKLLEVVHSKE